MKVVIVEDARAVVERLAAMLRKIDGVEIVATAETASAALEAISQHKPDVVTLDLQLPDNTGMAVLARVRQEQPALRVIVLTNYPDAEYRARCLGLGADNFFDKSSEFAKAVAVVADLAATDRPAAAQVDNEKEQD